MMQTLELTLLGNDSPACIASFLVTSLVRGEFKDAWSWSDDPEAEKEKERAKDKKE